MADRMYGRPAAQTETTISSASWDSRDLTGERHDGVLFLDVDMTEACGTGARCAGAKLREVDLSGASLHKADFSGCDLRGSDLSSLDPLTVELRRAVVDPYQAVVLATALGLDVRE